MDVRHGKCKGIMEDGSPCRTIPTFGTDKILYCSDHMEIGMTNLKDKRCALKNCPTVPHYGDEGGEPLWCYFPFLGVIFHFALGTSSRLVRS